MPVVRIILWEWVTWTDGLSSIHSGKCRNDADLSLGSIGSPRFEDYHRKVVVGTW